MKITETIVNNLIMLLDKHGLIHGAGDYDEEFCVQQAVNRVIHNDLYGQYSDNPGDDCLNEAIRSFGVHLNDHSHAKITSQQRAAALKRFAIAQLGSNMIDAQAFFGMLAENLKLRSMGLQMIEEFMGRQSSLSYKERLKTLADAAADVLKELGTEGSKFLHLVDEPNRKKKIQEARKLGKQIYAAQMANFGTTCCAVKPQQQ